MASSQHQPRSGSGNVVYSSSLHNNQEDHYQLQYSNYDPFTSFTQPFVTPSSSFEHIEGYFAPDEHQQQQSSCSWLPAAGAHLQLTVFPTSMGYGHNEMNLHLGLPLPFDSGAAFTSLPEDLIPFEPWPAECGGNSWKAPRFVSIQGDLYGQLPTHFEEYPVQLPDRPSSSNSFYASSPSTLDTATLPRSTPETRFQELMPSPVISTLFKAEVLSVPDHGASEENIQTPSNQIVTRASVVSKHGGRQPQRKDAKEAMNASRRKLKINKRFQEYQGGGNFDVFDSVEGRNCSHPRASFTPTRRKEVAAVRARGACFKCKLWKKKCDLNATCGNCNIAPVCNKRSTGLTDQPCFRLDLSDCGFFRTKSAAWTQPLRENMIWLSSEIVSLNIECIYHNGQGPRFTITCRQFKPEDSDIVSRKWGPAANQIIHVPTYCAFNLKEIRNELPRMIRYYYEQNLKEAISGSGSEDIPEIVVKTFRIAVERQAKEPLLKDAVEIWTGSRFIAAPRSLRGEQTLGLSPIQDESAHDRGNIPIPPMLDYQLDTLAIQRMEKTMNEMLKKLWKTLQAHSKSSWFDVFLVIFILVNNLEYVYEAQLQYVQEHGSEDAQREAFRRKIKKTSEKMLEHWDWTAKHLIYVFKYHIKRCAFDGAPLFSKEFISKAAKGGGLDEPAIKYLNDLVMWNDESEARADSSFQTKWCRELLVEKPR
ncbi:hypothetical protein FN846DRAFT_1023166 [Sphaerosporella brunnea]|uniref:Zn(2)-C6 fungal-type domain-containing protein n=1 Tax=Sphaerosporella brunnea TaxID=1250544 RepID=A0A5J5EQ68_9PEZI|nr:hypothetical protein FN846DRAFT_1023166 [Sphaerosporella brunnea]